jgi:hypothetical protein
MRLLVLLPLLVAWSLGARADPPRGATAFLKLNRYYVLYTRPQGPWVDPTGSLLLPLWAVRDLLAVDVRYDSRAGVFSARRRDRRATLAAPRWLATPVDDTPVAVGPLVRELGIRSAWDATSRTLILNDPSFTLEGFADIFEDWLDKTGTVDTVLLAPRRFALRSSVDAFGPFLQVDLELVPRGGSVQDGQQALYLIAVHTNRHLFPLGHRFPFPLDQPAREQRKDPCVKRGDVFRCRAVIPEERSPVEYLLARIRLRK